jgi:hypothetical protein
MWIELVWYTCLDVAESTVASADAAEDDECSMLLAPALAEVGTCSFLADGLELE